MKINLRTAKSVVTSRTTNEKYRKSLNGKEIEPVNQFVYLGQVISSDGRSEVDIKKRFSIARNKFNMLRRFMCISVRGLKTKLHMVYVIIWRRNLDYNQKPGTKFNIL